MHLRLRLTFAAVLFLQLAPARLSSCSAGESQPLATGKHGMVVSDSEPATKVGLVVLKRGGTAVDAAVATALALAVTHPEAGNIGGGGFMLVHPPGSQPVCIDYRETAPARAKRDTFALDESVHTHRIVGVPGTLRGLELAHQRYGKLPWRELVLPAVELARDGFVVDAYLAESLNELLADSREFVELQRVFSKPDGGQWRAGDTLVQPDLAATLQRIADDGPSAFYHGEIARQIIDEMEAGRGLMQLNDLQNYEAKLREPIRGTYRGYDIIGAPPPSSGGICVVQALNMLETFPLADWGRWSPETLHHMLETMRRVFYDRALYLGDPDFVDIPERLITEDYARQLASEIDPNRATPSKKLAAEIELAGESDSTTHFSIVDGAGMAVANTYTLEHSYGSRIVVRGAGFLLNNEMGDFNWKPGYTDRRGRIGTEPNTVAPGKRMLSSQSPTLVARDGRPVLVTGSPGGRTIINTVICVVLNVIEFEMDLRQAVDAPRLHHSWFPDQARFEGREKHAETVEKLQDMGHRFYKQPYEQGSANSIRIHAENGMYEGAADARRSAYAAGY